MDEQRFWSSALGEWIGDCVCGTSKQQNGGPIIPENSWRSASNLELQLRYAELCDGIVLNLIFLHLSSANDQQLSRLHIFQQHSETANGGVERSESLSSGVSSGSASLLQLGSQNLTAKIRQFQQLLSALSRFYRSKSMLILSFPDVLCIVRSPVPELSGHEMHKLLALLLGAAVQSPQREHFIERIKRMRPEAQSELAKELQKVTSGNGNSSVVNLDALMAELENAQTVEQGESHPMQIVAMLERAIRERDEFASGLLEIAQDLDQDDTGPSSGLTTASSSCNGDIPPAKCPGGGGRSPSPSALERHVSVELAAAKAELRKLRNENEEKEEALMELQDELEKQRVEIGRLQGERLELVKDARAAKDYKDEMDCMQHKLNRLERLEAENEKLRGRLGELDFFKSRVNHLKEDNKIMQETYRVMEEQLEQYQRKLSAQLEVETKLIEAQANNKSLQLDMTKTRERVEELLLENGRLERDLRASRQKCAELEREMHSMSEFASPRTSLEGMNGSLNESSLMAQLEAHNQSQILELQLENRKLKAQLDNANGSNPAELFELKSELAASEKIAKEKADECTKLNKELEELKKHAEECAEQIQKIQLSRDQMDRQLAELKRSSVPLKTHQTVMEQLEKAEQKSQALELRADVEKEQLGLVQAEKREVEAQLQKMCAQQKEARVELDSLKEQILTEQVNWDKQKKMLEGEKSTLKARLEALEKKEAGWRVAEQNAENLTRRIAELEREFAEQRARTEQFEAELLQARQQQDGELRKSQRFREELAVERDRLCDLLSRLRSVCLMAIHSGSGEAEQCCLEPSCLDDDHQLIAIIDDLLMKALCSARREADALRIQQQKQIRELDDLKRDIQSLRRTGHELNASDDKLLLENRNIKEQVNLLQERLHRAQTEECARTAELQAAKREIEELQQKAFANSRQSAELANVQTSLRNQRKQEDQLQRELTSAKGQLEAALKCHAETQKRLDSLELIHSALASDHDRLQNLHQMLSSDYDRIKREKEALRQKLKGEKSTTEQILRADFEREKGQLGQTLEGERMERQKEAKRAADLEAGLAKVNRELAEMKHEQSSTVHRNDDCLEELRRLRLADCSQKSTINNLNVIIQQLNNALTEKDLELANLRRQVEMLRQYNGDENKTLIRQIELLLIQNQQLHNRSDAFYAEQKELQEKLLTLRRHKEKLEEKIMEQYKSMDSRKLERPTFMKRAAKALIAKSPSRKGRPGKDGNSASEKSEESSSIYSTENELNGHRTPAGIASPPPCPVPSTTNGIYVSTTQSAQAQHQPKEQPSDPPAAPAPNSPTQHLPISRNGSSLCSASAYSSISHYQQNSIDREQQPSVLSPMTRARNGRIGGSLRCPPSNPLMARSFPAPGWRKPSREFPQIEEATVLEKLPACCKVMQADTLPENEPQLPNSLLFRPPSVASHQQTQILTGLPPKVPQHPTNRPPPPPYPGSNLASKLPNRVQQSRARSSPSPSRRSMPPSQQHHFGLPPRDSSTPMSGCGNGAKTLNASPAMPSPIGFSRANSLASNKPAESEPNPSNVNGLRVESLVNKKEATEFHENLDVVERPERTPSVYENVAEKNAIVKDVANEAERRGEKGEIWYELGCV